ncbi:MAG: hypothetical protein CMK82_11900, partial [Pseudomonadales bacterium]|nr:hypothetical protein [Pseudomonadales bacterium]
MPDISPQDVANKLLSDGFTRSGPVASSLSDPIEDMPMVVPQMDSDSSESEEEEEAAPDEQALPEKFDGEFNWDGFDGTQKLQEQNAQLLTQMDAKDKEIDELHVLMRAMEP